MKFIDKVRNFLNSEACESYVNRNPERSTEEIIQELLHEDVPKLKELGLLGGLTYDDTIIIECPINPEYQVTLIEGMLSYISRTDGSERLVRTRWVMVL